MIDADFVKAIETLANRGPVTLPVPGGPAHAYLLRGPGGSYEVKYADVQPVAHAAYDLDTVVRKAKEWGETPSGTVADIWYSRVGVTCQSGRERVKLALSLSPQLRQVAEWERAGKAVLKQDQLVYLLRTLFLNRAGRDLLDLVRNLDFKKSQQTVSDIQKGKVSMSKAMLAEVTGADRLPDQVTLYCPVFAQASMTGFTCTVRCAFEIDPQAEAFVISPIPGEVEEALGRAEQEVGAALGVLAGDQPEGGPRLSFYHGEW